MLICAVIALVCAGASRRPAASDLQAQFADQPLSDRAKFLMWAIGISYGLLVLFGVVAVFTARSARGAITAGASPNAGAMIGAGCIAILVLIALVIFGFMYLFMLIKFGQRFKEAAMYARQTWAAGA